MYIHELLEETSLKHDVEPMFEEYINEDVSSLEIICIDEDTSISETAVGLVQLEQLALVNEDVLNEGTFKNIFDKIINAIKTTWAKIKAFFQKLFKSIQVSVMDVNKALSNVEKFTNKDYSKFEYEGYIWNKSPNMHGAFKANCEKALKEQKQLASKVGWVTDNEIYKTKYNMTETQILNTVYSGSSKENTIQNIQKEIKLKYRTSENKVTIVNFGKGEKLSDMISFLKNFNKNEVLVSAQKDADSEFSELISLCDEAKAKSEKLIKEKNHDSSKEQVSTANANLVKHCQIARTLVAKYNTLMSFIIGLEKEKFSSYRGVVAKAIRYSPAKSEK